MERKYPGPDTGKIELQRIIKCMKENKYEYDENNLEAGVFDGCYTLHFVKQIDYSDTEGTNINDRRIKVTIEFDTSFDYETKYQTNKHGDFIYNNINNSNARNFITSLENKI
jgi:hypothetical protein